MPPREITKTRLSTASINFDTPKADAATGIVVKVRMYTVVRMKATEKIGGGAAQVSEFPVTDTGGFTITVNATGQGEIEAILAAGRGKINWRVTRPFRFNPGQAQITATLRGSVNEVDREADLATGKVTHNRSKPKGITRTLSIPIRVRL